MNLDKMSQSDLKTLRKDVDKALETLETRRKAEARKAAEEAAMKHGFDLADLVGDDRKSKRSGQKNPAKYRDSDDPSKTWTGRGRQPGWIKSALASGKSLNDFAI